MAKYDWGDGKGAVHSISLAQHQRNMAAQGPANHPFSEVTVSTGNGGYAPLGQYVAQQQPQGPTAPPPDPAFLAQQAQAQLAMGLGNAWDTYSRGRIDNEFGLGADVSNPFSRAALLQEQYQNNQRGTRNNYASQGQLYSGALQNAKDYNAHQYAASYDQLKRQYQAAKDQVTQGAVDRYSQYGSLTGADLASLLKQLGLG